MSIPDEEASPVHFESEGEFSEAVATGDRVLVDYHADWCGPCKMLEPTVEEIAEETDVLVGKVDIDELQTLARDEGIRSVPTLQFYADGEEVERLIGVQEKDEILEILSRFK